MSMKFYQVTTVAPEYGRVRNVEFCWFVDTRDSPAQRLGAQLIEGYEAGDPYHEDLIHELFDAAEAEAFADWLKVHRPDYGAPIVAEVKLPVPNNCIGLGAIPTGGGIDFLSMKDESGAPAMASLGFTTLGYHDLRGCELVDEPGETFRPYLLVLGPDGLRRQTQAEARQMEADHWPA
jgi:hypothetical protein